MSRLQDIGQEILAWYRDNRRDLPWRKTSDPYEIWISEIMCQQTRVDTVIGYYTRFMERFPDIASLAAAEEEEVLVLWKGLGYYSRARNLWKAAKIVADRYGGSFPDSLEAVRSLPGIGDYTAGAILSIAFNQAQTAVDGNVLRVVARLEGLEEDILLPAVKQRITGIVSRMLPPEHAGDFNQGLMELGALVCIPQNPRCSECPVQNSCIAHATGCQTELPLRKGKKQPSPELLLWAPMITDREGRILLEYRETETLLGRMWGVPLLEKTEDAMLGELFEARYGLSLITGASLGNAEHVFSHKVWHMEAVNAQFLAEPLLPPALKWFGWEETDMLAVPRAFQKVLKLADPRGIL